MNAVIEEIKLLYTNITLAFLGKALLVSLGLALGIFLASLFVGTILAMLKTYGPKFFRKFVTIYVEIFRNTPILYWVCLCFIALPFGNRYIRAASGLFFPSAATVCEIVRGGLNSIDHGQLEAGYSQGLSKLQVIGIIVLPQCIRRVVPNLINQIISVFKDTSFFGQVAIPEFLYCSRQLLGTANKYTGHGIEARDAFIIFGVAAIAYFTINLLLSNLIRRVEFSSSRRPKKIS